MPNPSEIPRIAFDLLRVGSCQHPECIVMRGSRWKTGEFPALIGLLRHPTLGLILYDTGYAKRFQDATKTMPECLYRMVTPVRLAPEEELLSQLSERGIKPEEIGTIIISHFHADHIAGLRDFPKARLLSTKAELTEMTKKPRLARVARGFLSSLLPEDLETRTTYAEDAQEIPTGLASLPIGHDLLGDGSLIGIQLPGHTKSQLGILFQNQDNLRTFLVADGCWKIEGLEKRALPSRITALLFASWTDYETTFRKLAEIHQSADRPTIIPSHCQTTWEALGGTRNVTG